MNLLNTRQKNLKIIWSCRHNFFLQVETNVCETIEFTETSTEKLYVNISYVFVDIVSQTKTHIIGTFKKWMQTRIDRIKNKFVLMENDKFSINKDQVKAILPYWKILKNNRLTTNSFAGYINVRDYYILLLFSLHFFCQSIFFCLVPYFFIFQITWAKPFSGIPFMF